MRGSFPLVSSSGQGSGTQSVEEHRKAKSARNKRALAAKLTDNAQLITALAFYRGRLSPGEWVFLGKSHGGRLRCPYLKAARLVLYIRGNEDDEYRLPGNYLQRLRSIGLLPLVDLGGAERRGFEELNADLVVDDAVKAFSDDHQILDRVKGYLETDFPWAKRAIRREPVDDDSQEELDHDEPLGPAMGSPKPSRERLYQPPGPYQPYEQAKPTPKAPEPESGCYIAATGGYVLWGTFATLRKYARF